MHGAKDLRSGECDWLKAAFKEKLEMLSYGLRAREKRRRVSRKGNAARTIGFFSGAELRCSGTAIWLENA